ncbi:MAG: hypothetical protein ACNA71_03400, partial [Kiritimatiellia bacterium]
VISGRRTERPAEVLTRFRILPLWYYENVQKKVSADVTEAEDVASLGAGAESVSRYMRLWPLGVYRRADGHSLTRIPDLWPLRNTPAIERNWAPLWTLYRHERAQGRYLSELLWGLVRVEASAGEREWSVFPVISSHQGADTRSWRFLYGLLGYQRDGLQKSYQVLYFLRIRRRVCATVMQENEGVLLP